LLVAFHVHLAAMETSHALDDPAERAVDVAQPEAALHLKTFDAVWNHVRNDYFDYARIEPIWIEARDEFRPQASTANRAELRALLNRMLDRIGESHFLVLPPTGVPVASDRAGIDAPPSPVPSQPTGLGVRLIDGALIIDRVGEANTGLIEPGWELTAIGDETLDARISEVMEAEEPAVRERAELILEASANGRIGYPDAGEELALTLRDPAGKAHTVIARTRPEEIDLVRIGNLPALPFSYRSEILGDPVECVGAVTFTTWVPQLMDEFLASRDALFACDGLVIDLRGNLGGVLTTMVPLSSHLVAEPVLLGQLTRQDGRIDFRAFPRRVADDGSRIAPFDGPIAILIDSLSASTSEMFTSGLQALGRARVFGTHSPGMALPAQMLPLPNGDRLMYAFADYIDGRGRRIEGIGVTPDEIIATRRSDLIAGSDPVMTAALAWLGNQNKKETL
jgi:carboxyl-terminal processing protease